MHIQNDRSTGNTQELTTITKKNYSSPIFTKNYSDQKDTIQLPRTNKMSGSILSLDKGTAFLTTLYVDNATFQKITAYTTNHPDNQWSELGKDGDKRWIVVNGQRFESPLSEEEKAMMKRAQMTLGDHLDEAEEYKEKTEPKEKVTLDFTSNDVINESSENPKIVSLLKNEKVMAMLKDISKGSFGKLSISF